VSPLRTKADLVEFKQIIKKKLPEHNDTDILRKEKLLEELKELNVLHELGAFPKSRSRHRRRESASEKKLKRRTKTSRT